MTVAGRRLFRWRRPDGWSVTVVLIAALVLSPLLYILYQLFLPTTDAWDHVKEFLLPRYAQNTVILLQLTLGWAFLFGVLPAWLVSAYQFPGRRVLAWLLATPLAVPSYIAAFAWSGLLDYSGPLQSWLRESYGLEAAQKVPEITNLPGVSFVLGSVLFPYVFMTTRAALLLQSGTQIEAARALGATGPRLFFSVVLPSLRPAIVAGLALVAMETLNNYGAVHYFGVDTLTTGVFRSFHGLGDHDAGIRLASVLLLGAALLFALERLARGRRRFDSGGATRPLRREKLRRPMAALAILACLLPILVGLVIPVGMLVWWSFYTWSDTNFGELAELAFRSGALAFAGALVVVVFALLLAYASRFRRRRWIAGLVAAAGTGYAVPGAVIAVGVASLATTVDAFAWDRGWIDGLFLAGTTVAMVWAYSVRFLAVGLHPLDAAFQREGQTLDEAARSLGARPSTALVKVHIPVLRGAIAAAATLTFIDILKELPLTLILRPFDFNTLATHTYNFAKDEMVPRSAPSALLLILFGSLAVWIANRAIVGKETSSQ